MKTVLYRKTEKSEDIGLGHIRRGQLFLEDSKRLHDLVDDYMSCPSLKSDSITPKYGCTEWMRVIIYSHTNFVGTPE